MPDAHGWTAVADSTATWGGSDSTAASWTAPSEATATTWGAGSGDTSATWNADDAIAASWTAPSANTTLAGAFRVPSPTSDGDIGVEFQYIVTDPPQWYVLDERPIPILDAPFHDPNPWR